MVSVLAEVKKAVERAQLEYDKSNGTDEFAGKKLSMLIRLEKDAEAIYQVECEGERNE